MRIQLNGELYSSLDTALKFTQLGDVITLVVEDEVLDTWNDRLFCKDLAAIVSDVESRFAFGGNFDVGRIEIAGIAYEFTHLMSGGVFEPEGLGNHGIIPCKCSSLEVAIQLFRDALERYIAGRTAGTVYWRVKPSIHRWKPLYEKAPGFTGWYTVWSRLLII